jgi:hypothetical protein
MTTGTFQRTRPAQPRHVCVGVGGWNGSRSCSGNRIVNANIKPQQCWGVFKSLGLLVPVDSTPCGASISGLSTQSSSWGPYNHEGLGDLILRKASRLDAFSGYPDRT